MGRNLVGFADSLLAYSLFTGTPHSTIQCSTLTFDRFAGKFLHHLVIEVNNVAVDLDSLLERLRDLHGFLYEWAEKNVGYKFETSVNLLVTVKYPEHGHEAYNVGG